MMAGNNQKITSSHLKRDAYLYVRQSTIRQVLENTESTRRQYALRQRAVALGWPMDRVHVIDSDLGQSGASAGDREGFKRLVSEVSLGNVGIVLGLEVSRLARNCGDWHRLLEICALSDTLILDEDGLYNANDFNDRLLLGLKGTMSEAELHFIRARLQGGTLSKARRGELASPLPIGFVYDQQKRVKLDPDVQVRQAINLFFQTFRRTGSAMATVKHFRRQGVLFPRRPHSGSCKGELVWGEMEHSRALQLLHNPRFAGAFFFGRTHTKKKADGRTLYESVPREEWLALIPNHHPGYISWDEYEHNLRRLRENIPRAYGKEHKKSPPREGPALLQGLVICGVCGRRMTVSYRARRGGIVPNYLCTYGAVKHGQRLCQHIRGDEIDKAISDLLLSTLTPMALEVALSVQQELSARLEEADRLRAKQVERSRYEVQLARRRYMQVDPDNRLVADALEADWNQKLRNLKEAQEEYERQRKADRLNLDEDERRRIMALSTDFPRLWNDPAIPHRERKRMVRLLLEDVTLVKKENISVHVRFKGGKTTTITFPAPRPASERWRTPPETVAEIDRLLDHYTEAQIVTILNQRGICSGMGLPFTHGGITWIRTAYGLKSHYQRLREAGMLTLQEIAEYMGVHTCTIRLWKKNGLLQAHPYNDKNQCLYPPPGPDAPIKWKHKKIAKKQQVSQTYLQSNLRGAV
jgi:DNA invertase Pin-like site-specific DNA recombinase